MEFLSQASFVCLAETCRRACWQPAGVTVPTALPPWERVLEALPNCSVLFLSVTWYRRAAGPRKVCSFSQTMSKTDATPEKQNRQVARDKSYKSVNRQAELIQFLRLEKSGEVGLSLVCWCTLPFETFGPPLLHAHQKSANANAENWKGLFGG